MKLKENAGHVLRQPFSRKKSILSEIDIILRPHSRVFCVRDKVGFFIIAPPTASSSDTNYLRQLLSCTESFNEGILTRYIAHDVGLLLKATSPDDVLLANDQDQMR